MSGLRLGVIGAGPVGLSLALLAAVRWPRAHITLIDARPAPSAPLAHGAAPPAPDGRALALSWGSAQTLATLGLAPDVLSALGAPIAHVHVSQAPRGASKRSVLDEWATTQIHADRVGLPRLGSVVRYTDLVTALDGLWAQRVAAEPQRLGHRCGQRVPADAPKPVRHGSRTVGWSLPQGGVDAVFDLLIHAEGQTQPALQPLSSGLMSGWDYGQTAWVGEAVLQSAPAGARAASAPQAPWGQPDAAFERFTDQGPLAVLPLRPAPGQKLAPGQHAVSVVWCLRRANACALQDMDEPARCAAVQALLPSDAPRVLSMGPLRPFDLALQVQPHRRAPRQLAVGNAAQTLHPVAGQGLNLGLRDAGALITCLTEAQRAWSIAGAPARLADQMALDHAIRAWTAQRRSDRALTVGLTHTLATAFLPGGVLMPALRDGLLGLTQAMPPLKRVLGQQLIWGWRG